MTNNTGYAVNNYGKMVKAEKGLLLKAKEEDLEFSCPSCKKSVWPYTEGSVQQPHFRHIGESSTNNTGNCSQNESYLHWISKELFADNWNKISNFILFYNKDLKCIQARGSFCIKKQEVSIDLKEKYPYISIEKRDGSFVPDCMIYNDSNEKIYIEIKHSSSVSDKKRKSGIPIIEIDIPDESAIEIIEEVTKKNRIDISRGFARLYNFKILSDINVFDCYGACLYDGKIPEEKREILKKDAKETLSSFMGLSSNHIDQQIVKRRLDALERFNDIKNGSAPPEDWYLIGHFEKTFYRKNQDYYLFLYDYKYYGLFQYGNYIIYTVKDGIVSFIGETTSLKNAHTDLEAFFAF